MHKKCICITRIYEIIFIFFMSSRVNYMHAFNNKIVNAWCVTHPFIPNRIQQQQQQYGIIEKKSSFSAYRGLPKYRFVRLFIKKKKIFISGFIEILKRRLRVCIVMCAVSHTLHAQHVLTNKYKCDADIWYEKCACVTPQNL